MDEWDSSMVYRLIVIVSSERHNLGHMNILCIACMKLGYMYTLGDTLHHTCTFDTASACINGLHLQLSNLAFQMLVSNLFMNDL